MARIVLRVRGDGELYATTRGRSGMGDLIDPSHGAERHRGGKHLVTAETVEQAVELVRQNMRPRMRGLRSGQSDMFGPGNMWIVGVPD